MYCIGTCIYKHISIRLVLVDFSILKTIWPWCFARVMNSAQACGWRKPWIWVLETTRACKKDRAKNWKKLWHIQTVQVVSSWMIIDLDISPQISMKWWVILDDNVMEERGWFPTNFRNRSENPNKNPSKTWPFKASSFVPPVGWGKSGNPWLWKHSEL